MLCAEDEEKKAAAGLTNLEDMISVLHERVDSMRNMSSDKDVFGRPFQLPVDIEHKATVFSACTTFSVAQPHMRSFWAASFAFGTSFFSVFAPAALMPYLQRAKSGGGIELTLEQINDSDAAAVGSTIIMRIVSGPLCEYYGARKTMAGLLLVGLPGVVWIMFVHDGPGLVGSRLIIGLSLASFVACQVWCSQMFSKHVVGHANATAAGWGNMGAGITQLVMPHVMLGMLRATGNQVDLSWRLSFLVPVVLQLFAVCFALSARDLPDGNYRELEALGYKQKPQLQSNKVELTCRSLS